MACYHFLTALVWLKQLYRSLPFQSGSSLHALKNVIAAEYSLFNLLHNPFTNASTIIEPTRRLSNSALTTASISFYPIYMDKNRPFWFSSYSMVWPSVSRKQTANISCRTLGIQLHTPFSVQEAKTAAPLLRQLLSQLFFFIQQHLVSQNPKPALAKHIFPNKKEERLVFLQLQQFFFW